MKRTFLLATAVTGVVGLFALALNAQSLSQALPQPQGQGQPMMTVTEIAARLEGQGYTVYEIERERNHFEVKIADGTGMRVTAYLNATTGEILRYGSDDNDRYDDED